MDELRARRPGDHVNIDRIRKQMEVETVLYRLRQLREEAGFTQTALAEMIGVGQNRVSQMEHGKLGVARVDTLRRYVEATGGELELCVRRADGTRVPLALAMPGTEENS